MRDVGLSHVNYLTGARMKQRDRNASANDAEPVKAGVYDVLASLGAQISRRLGRVFALIKTRRYKLAAILLHGPALLRAACYQRLVKYNRARIGKRTDRPP